MNRQELANFMTELLMAWQARDTEKVEQMYSKEVVGHMDDKIVKYDDIMNRLQYSINNFKEVINEILDIIVEGDKVVTRIKQTLISKVDGSPTIYRIIAIYRIKDHKVLETWASFFPNVNYLKNN